MTTGEIEILEWFSYRRQGTAGVVALRRSNSSYAIDWLLQEQPPGPALPANGYLASVASTEPFGAAGQGARRRFTRLRQQLSGFVTDESRANSNE